MSPAATTNDLDAMRRELSALREDLITTLGLQPEHLYAYLATAIGAPLVT